MNDPLREKYRQQLTPPRRGRRFFAVFLLIHAVLIFGPLLYFAVLDFFAPPPVNMFRVKIGGRELSHGREVGPPERTRPKPPAPPKPASPEPKPTPPKPKPTPPKSKPKPKPSKPKPTPPKTKPKPAAKKTETKPKPVAKKTAQPTKKTSEAVRRPKTVEEAQSQVYHAESNFNPNVPIGSRNRAQALGKQDNRTPAGGATEEDEAFGKRLGLYLENRWAQPPKIKLGDTLPTTLIELEISSDGRVTAKRIVLSSGNAAMDESVQRMLDQLDRVPSPPRGKTVLQISMQTK